MDQQARTHAYVTRVEDVIDAERRHLRRIRAWRYAGTGDAGPPLLGLALSGGGIRSAAFAIGVMHALVRHDKLRWFDYLSTVSGGGYAGSALTWMLSTYEGADVVPNSAAGLGSFPLSGWRQGRRASAGNVPGAFDERPYRRLDWVRMRANFLTPTDELTARAHAPKSPDAKPPPPSGPPHGPPRDALPRGGLSTRSLIGVVLRSVVIGLLTYLPAMLVLMLGLGWIIGGIDAFVEPRWPAWKASAAPLTGSAWEGLFLLIAAAALAIFVAGCLIYALVTRINRLWAYPMRTRVQWLGGHVLTVTLVGVVMATLPYAPAGAQRLMTAAGLTAGGIAAGALRLLLRGRPGSKAEWSTGLVAIAGGLALCYGLLLGTHIVAFDLLDAIRADERPDGFVGIIHDHPWWTTWITLGWAIGAGLFLNLNYVTPHRMYRDRLMETFMPPGPVARERFREHTPDRAPLADMCGAGEGKGEYPGPYHLINTNVVLSGSRFEGARGRGGDSFLLSPLYCGAYHMGWYPTQGLGQARLAVNRWSMTLATAMSISGAAANPNTGALGRGPTRTWAISFLMNLLHLRLGYVEVNPRWVDRLREPWARGMPSRPNGLWPGLIHLLGGAHHEEALFVELTDGGHFENLGLYELLRREARLIICTDAACDGGFSFPDLGNAIERARVDFGVNIGFRGRRGLAATVLEPLKPGDNAFKATLAERGFAIAEIRYAPTRRPPKPGANEPIEAPDQDASRTGILIFVKSTLIPGLPADIYAYRANNPTFPHETTADQFFDEAQFESYRELGYRLMSQAIGAPAVRTVLGKSGEPPPAAGPAADHAIAEAFKLADLDDL